MIGIQEQQNLFIRIAEKLPRKIEVYAIGGTAMMFLGLKDKTIDVDLVFKNVEDRKIFKETAILLGFREFSAHVVYGKRDNVPEMIVLGDVRIDLFLFKIISSYFSDSMQKRATQTHEFGSLIIRVADSSDILIMKSVTSREKDMDDIISIVKEGKINWNIVVEESKNQVSLGKESAIMNLGEKLERLTNQKIIYIPKDVLDKIWKLFNRQVKEKAKKSR